MTTLGVRASCEVPRSSDCGTAQSKNPTTSPATAGLRFLPECHMVSTEIRDRPRTLRYRHLLARRMVQMKNGVSVCRWKPGCSITSSGYTRWDILTSFCPLTRKFVPLSGRC